MNPLAQEKPPYTYADYLTWNDENRYELINGEPYLISPAPSRTHQKVSGEIHRQLANFLKGKSCEIYSAPFDVRLNADTADNTVCQPDLLVICDPAKLEEKGCMGAPDFIIEIISPSSAVRDRVVKFNQYLQAGVREYWIIDPDSKTVSVHILENGKYMTNAYGEDDSVPVHILEGCQINLQDAFAD